MAPSREPSEHGDLEWFPLSRPSKGRCSSMLHNTVGDECSPPGSPTISPRTTRSDGFQ